MLVVPISVQGTLQEDQQTTPHMNTDTMNLSTTRNPCFREFVLVQPRSPSRYITLAKCYCQYTMQHDECLILIKRISKGPVDAHFGWLSYSFQVCYSAHLDPWSLAPY